MNYVDTIKSFIKENSTQMDIEFQKVESWMEKGLMKSGSTKESDKGLHLMDLEYQLFLKVSTLKKDAIEKLILLVNQYKKSVNSKGIDSASFSYTTNESGVDMTFSMLVYQPIYVVEVSNSPIEFGGKKWGIGDGSINVAESLSHVNVNKVS
jgi:hypothetical protein